MWEDLALPHDLPQKLQKLSRRPLLDQKLWCARYPVPPVSAPIVLHIHYRTNCIFQSYSLFFVLFYYRFITLFNFFGKWFHHKHLIYRALHQKCFMFRLWKPRENQACRNLPIRLQEWSITCITAIIISKTAFVRPDDGSDAESLFLVYSFWL